jgi:Na+/proline symporter
MVLYALLLVSIGFFLRGRASGSVEDYFIGGRKMPWWLLGTSGMAQFVDITGTALIISFLFMMGPKALLVELRGGLCIHMVIILLWAGKWHRRSGCITGAEWMIFRFGNGPDGKAARIITAISMQIFTIGMVTYLSKGVGIFFSTFLPFSPETCSLAVILIACLYTAVSGFYGVVFTDLFQAFMIIVAVAVVTVMAIGTSWFGGGLPELATKISGFDSWMSALPQWKVSMPAGYENYNWLGILAIFYLTKTLINGLGGGGEPKYFGARNDRECGTLTFFWTSLLTFRWPLMIGVAILGFHYINQLIPDMSVLNDAALMIKTALPGIQQADWGNVISNIINRPDQYPALVEQLQAMLGQSWTEQIKMLSFHGTVNAERILPAVILHSIPVGLKGLLIISLTAACMSTFDSNVNWAVGFITHDIYHAYIKPKAKNKELITVSWISTFAIGLIGYYTAYNVKNINDIWGWLMMALGTGFFVPSFIKFYWGRFNGWGFTSGMAMGVGGAVVQRAFWPELSEFYQFLAMGGLGLFGSITGTLLTKPMDPEILKNFYIKTKPFGFWGKLKNTLDPETREKLSREHFYDIISLPFVLLWHYLLLLLPVLLVIGNFKEFTGGAALFFIALIGIYFFWYKKLPKENYYDDV